MLQRQLEVIDMYIANNEQQSFADDTTAQLSEL